MLFHSGDIGVVCNAVMGILVLWVILLRGCWCCGQCCVMGMLVLWAMLCYGDIGVVGNAVLWG